MFFFEWERAEQKDEKGDCIKRLTHLGREKSRARILRGKCIPETCVE